MGVGIAEPPVLSGVSGFDTVIAPRVESPAPVAGIVLSVPLGVDKGADCKNLMALELQTLKLETAKQMAMDGLITQEQLQAVIDRTYQLMTD
jgi:hypothetical protein